MIPLTPILSHVTPYSRVKSPSVSSDLRVFVQSLNALGGVVSLGLRNGLSFLHASSAIFRVSKKHMENGHQKARLGGFGVNVLGAVDTVMIGYGEVSLTINKQDRREISRVCPRAFSQYSLRRVVERTLRFESVGCASTQCRGARFVVSLRRKAGGTRSVFSGSGRSELFSAWRRHVPQIGQRWTYHGDRPHARTCGPQRSSSLCGARTFLPNLGSRGSRRLQRAGTFEASQSPAERGRRLMIAMLNQFLFPRAASDAAAGAMPDSDDGRHIPVMLAEVLEAANVQKGEHVVDCTFGAGGYTKAFLDAGVSVTAFDRDPDAIAEGQPLVDAYDNLTLVHQPFSAIEEILAEKVDVIVLDIGVSSMQFDRADRGFSFRFDGPLDMRMAQEGVSAADVIAKADHGELAYIFKMLGEERQAGRIASAIVREREKAPITTTAQLAILIEKTCPRKHKDRIHPATKVFQALRIFVNDELGELAELLYAAERSLNPGGRLIAVCFHSLEDRIVKRFFSSSSSSGGTGSRHLPNDPSSQQMPTFAMGPMKKRFASEEEKDINPRARSASLRMGERTDAAARMPDMDALGFDRFPRVHDFLSRPRKGR